MYGVGLAPRWFVIVIRRSMIEIVVDHMQVPNVIHRGHSPKQKDKDQPARNLENERQERPYNQKAL